MKNENTTLVRIQKTVHDKLKKLAEADNRSMANYLETLINNAYAEMK